MPRISCHAVPSFALKDSPSLRWRTSSIIQVREKNIDRPHHLKNRAIEGVLFHDRIRELLVCGPAVWPIFDQPFPPPSAKDRLVLLERLSLSRLTDKRRMVLTFFMFYFFRLCGVLISQCSISKKPPSTISAWSIRSDIAEPLPRYSQPVNKQGSVNFEHQAGGKTRTGC